MEKVDKYIVSVVLREVDNFNRSTGNKIFSYFADIELAPKDLVVIPVIDNSRDETVVGYAIGQIRDVDGLSRKLLREAEHHILCRLDTENFEKALEAQKRIAEIRFQLQQRKEEIEDMVTMREIGKADKRTQKLLKKLGKLAPELKLLGESSEE